MPYITIALKELNNVERNSDRRKVLVSVLKTPMKLANIILRIGFLIACRRADVVPNFITQATSSISKTFAENRAIQKECEALQFRLLNESIKDAFRSKAYLERCQRRHLHDILSEIDKPVFEWMKTSCRRIFEDTMENGERRLTHKFWNLVQSTRGVQRADREKKTLKPPEETEGETEGAKRVNNLSKATFPAETLNLLSKGPKFALTPKIDASVLQKVELGVERLAYGKRWKDFSQRYQPTSPNAQISPPDRAICDSVTSLALANQHGNQRGNQRENQEPMEPDGPELHANQQPASSTATGGFSRRFVPRFPDAVKKQPPPTTTKEEDKLRKLKKQVIGTFKNHKQERLNTTEEERKGLQTLKKNDEVIVKPSDKCKGLVILNKTDYVKKVDEILQDDNNYEKLQNNPTAKVEAGTKRIFKAVTKDKLPSTLAAELVPSHSRTPVMYGLPKDHKENVPLRPIISACGGPTEKTSWLLERILNQLLQFVPAHLRNTDDYLKRLAEKYPDQQLPENAIIFSIDVVNLYGSIPLDEGVTAVVDFVKEHQAEIDMCGLTPEDLAKLLTHCLENNCFRFDDKHYKQKLGIAMGNKVAPPVAIIFMHQFEKTALNDAPLKPDFYSRYIDDTLGIWLHGPDELRNFITYLNSLHSTIKFTVEDTTVSGEIPFLDTKISVDENYKYATELYIKSNHSGVILHHDSAHPMATKKAVIRSQYQRAAAVSSNEAARKRSTRRITDLFKKNGYPERLLQQLQQEAAPERPRRAERKHQMQLNQRRGQQQQQEQRRQQDRELDGYLTLPYIDETLCAKINSISKKSGLKLRIAWQSENTLKGSLVSSAFSKPPCPSGSRFCNACNAGLQGKCLTAGVVYQLNCNLCAAKGADVSYVGETKRPIRLRLNEHVLAAKNQTPDTPLGDHFMECHPSDPVPPNSVPVTVKILQKTKDHPERKLTESLFIRKLQPSLNKNIASWRLL